MEKCMLSTIDNPCNPFEDFEGWYQYDTAHGYHTCEYLARFCHTAQGLPENMQNNPQYKNLMDDIYMDLKLPSDISRISAQVISGLGFIGAGAIIVTKKHTIKGLTTAAGLLTTGIIGLTIGSGYYELGMLGTALVLITETWLGALGARIKHHPEYIVEIQYQEKDSLDRVLRCCKDNHLDIVNLKIRSQEDHPAVNYSANVHLRGGAKAEEMLEKIQMIPGITSVELM